jgi:hypothetical protein
MGKSIDWKREPKGPGNNAFHMFLDAGGERVELLAYDCPASHGNPRMCGFEVFGRLRKGVGPFWNQLAAGEASSLEEAMRAAREMVAKPREKWAKLPRSWVKLS